MPESNFLSQKSFFLNQIEDRFWREGNSVCKFFSRLNANFTDEDIEKICLCLRDSEDGLKIYAFSKTSSINPPFCWKFISQGRLDKIKIVPDSLASRDASQEEINIINKLLNIGLCTFQKRLSELVKDEGYCSIYYNITKEDN